MSASTSLGAVGPAYAGVACPAWNGDPNWSGYWCQLRAGPLTLLPLIELGTGPQTGVRNCVFDIVMYCVTAVVPTSGNTRCAWLVVEVAWSNYGPGNLGCVTP